MISFFEEKPDLLLAVNGAEETLQIVIGHREDEEEPYSLLEAKKLVVPGRSVNFLVPSIRDSLKLFGCTAADISRVAICSGPGSFTGLRLTFAAAAGLVAGITAEGKGLIGAMEYLPILARAAALASGEPVWAITHSRRMQVYLQGFNNINEGDVTPEPITPPLPVTVQEAAEVITSYGQDRAALVGTGLVKNNAFFQEFLAGNGQFHAMPENFNTPGAKDIIAVANHIEYGRTVPVPMYLRGSDAEENLESITRKRGISFEQARKQLAHITPK